MAGALANHPLIVRALHWTYSSGWQLAIERLHHDKDDEGEEYRK
jgi:hypothetical protein